MRITRIRDSLPGETILSVHPTPMPQLVADWRRRLNYYTGRSLSGVALSAEQDGRSGHLATIGQATSYGVVSGFAVRATEGAEPQLMISPGRGITPGGEDVVVAESLAIDWRQLDVVFTEDAPPSLLEAVQLQRLATRIEIENDQPVTLLDWLTAQNEDGPNAHVGVLVLQPVVYGRFADLGPDDPCEIDPDNDAFDDRRWVDGCRIAFHVWPDSWSATLDAANSTWRNELAYRIFEAESALQAGQIMPWETHAVPIALIGIAADNTIDFIDRNSIVRSAGKPKIRKSIVENHGSGMLWHARIHQFAEQVADQISRGQSYDEISDSFDFIPPTGVAPLDTVQLMSVIGDRPQRLPIAQESFFSRFSSDLSIRYSPIPEEELDLALRASQSQRPFERDQTDEMQLLIPVPQRYFDPRLLIVEQVAAIFGETMAAYIARRAEWLQRRQLSRRSASKIIRSISGTGTVYPDPDPGALGVVETVGADPLVPTEPTFAMSVALLTESETDAEDAPQGNVLLSYDVDDANGTLTMNVQVLGMAIGEIQGVQLRHGSNGSEPVDFPVDFEDTNGDGVLHSELSIEVTERIDDLVDGNLHLDVLSNNSGRTISGQLALSPIDRLEVNLRSVDAIQSEADQLGSLGVAPFMDELERKVKQADDVVDIGFTAANSALYRVRQLMLGTTDASRLATSPALAAIAVKGESASTTRDDIRRFIDDLKLKDTDEPVEEGRTPSVEDTAPRDTSGLGGVGPLNTVSGGFQTGTSGSTVLHNFGEISGGFPRDGFVALDPGDALDPRAVQGVDLTRGDASSEFVAAFAQPITPRFEIETSILNQLYLPGKPELPRNITIGERLRISESNETKNAAVATFYQAVTSVMELQMNVDDIEVSGIVVVDGDNAVSENRRAKRESHSIAELKADDELLKRIRDDPDIQNPDEADHYSAAIDILEHCIALLRRVEGRVQQYRAAIAECQRTLAELQRLAVQADKRLKEISDELAEARHDVSVGQSLIDEEQSRVDAINAHRDQIVSRHVKYVAFHRPRMFLAAKNPPARDLDPGITEEPLPACLSREIEDMPDELRAMIDLVRDVPIKWFPRISNLLNKLDQPPVLERSLRIANRRARTHLVNEKVASFQVGTTLFSQSIGKVFAAQTNIVNRFRAISAQTNIAAITKLGWKATNEEAKKLVTLGDLFDSDHARSEVVQEASRELDLIAKVANCLYRAVGGIPSEVRLAWAENISQFDQPVDLSDLTRLPKWGDSRIEFPQRIEIQSLNRWLYARVNPKESEAIGLMNDLVRVCILLASHAPVKKILSGRIEKPAPLQLDANVLVRFTSPNVRIGMPVQMYKANRVVARAVVDDIVGGRAMTRVLQVYQSHVVMDKDDHVQFGERAGSSFGSGRETRFLR